ncbi:MAG TPA: hypothetical protein VGH28_16295 [Polyangiaceae bacterium]|jgi:hypothetical protein
MDGVNGLSNQNLYDDGDIEHMKGLENLSTNAAINRIGNDAGLDTTHAIHGSDKTSKEIVAAHREAVRQEWSPVAVAPDAVGHAASHVAEHLAEHGARLAFRAMAGAALPIHLVMFAKEMADAVAADSVVGHERAEAFVKSAMHTVILGSLNGLPQAFVDSERARYADDAPADLVSRMSAAMGRGDNNLMGVIQLHCDQGMSAAREMYGAGQTPGDYLKAHADVAQRIAEDPAFKAGFEGAVYGREHGNYDAMMTALDARDARYAQHNVGLRG